MNIPVGPLFAMVYVDGMAHSVPHDAEFMDEMTSQMGSRNFLLTACHASLCFNVQNTNTRMLARDFVRTLSYSNLDPICRWDKRIDKDFTDVSSPGMYIHGCTILLSVPNI